MSSIHQGTAGRKLLPTLQVCRRYGVIGRTVNRWQRYPDLGFPQAVTINRRKYWAEADLDRWDAEVAAKGEVGLR